MKAGYYRQVTDMNREGIGMTSQRTRERLVQRLMEEGIRNLHVLESIRSTPRHLFIEEALSHRAYEDVSLPIGFNQTISQPFIVARMTELLLDNCKENPNVLEIGTGCGYQSAILAPLVKRVYSIERVEALLERTRSRLKELGLHNIMLRCADGRYGWPQHAPYDGIIITAAAPEIPPELVSQLAEGGVMVLPVGSGSNHQLKVCKKVSGKLLETDILPVVFVPLLDGIERAR